MTLQEEALKKHVFSATLGLMLAKELDLHKLDTILLKHLVTREEIICVVCLATQAIMQGDSEIGDGEKSFERVQRLFEHFRIDREKATIQRLATTVVKGLLQAKPAQTQRREEMLEHVIRYFLCRDDYDTENAFPFHGFPMRFSADPDASQAETKAGCDLRANTCTLSAEQYASIPNKLRELYADAGIATP
ncbi:MAG: hypothetical protein ABIH21_05850 [Patescibacteria group bacterium]